MIKIKTFKGLGRGLVTTKPIKKGSVILTVETIELNRKDSKIITQTLLDCYNYATSHGKSCIALGLGSLFNHSENENVDFSIIKRRGRIMIQYTALRHIKAGQQLFINYGYDPTKSTKKEK